MANIALLAGCLIPGLYLGYTDIKRRILPDKITIPMIITGFIYSVCTGNLQTGITGSVSAFLLFFMTAFIFGGGIGGGDIKLAAGLGMWFGFPDVLYIIIAGIFMMVIYELGKMLSTGKLKSRLKETTIPFFRGIFLRIFLKIKAVPDIKQKEKDYGMPLGTFLIISSWLVWGTRIF